MEKNVLLATVDRLLEISQREMSIISEQVFSLQKEQKKLFEEVSKLNKK
jgi:hypothetical protein